MLGRPNGYTSAAIIMDKTVTCDGLGADCGATIEVWPTADAAKARATEIQSIYKAMPALGAGEYDYVNGSTILRVGTKVTPEVAAQYHAAFGGDKI
jgi:hypothetical protein